MTKFQTEKHFRRGKVMIFLNHLMQLSQILIKIFPAFSSFKRPKNKKQMIVKLFIDFFSDINFDCAIPLIKVSKVSKTFVVFKKLLHKLS